MKYFLVISLALLANLVAATPHVTMPSLNVNSAFVSAIKSKSKLVQGLTTNLRDANLLQKLVKDTEKFNNYTATYTPNVQEMVSELRHLIITAGDNFFDAIRPVHGWCSQAKELLEAFFGLSGRNDDATVAVRNDIIKNLLDDDFASTVSEKLKLLSTNLNEASIVVSSITTQFDFTEQSELFKLLLRDEFIKDRNKHTDIIKTAAISMVQFRSNPQISPQVIDAIAQTILDQGPAHNPLEAFDRVNQQQQHQEHYKQQQQQLPHEPAVQSLVNNMQQTGASYINPQEYEKFKNQVLGQFNRTRDFFESFAHQLDDTMSRVNAIQSMISSNKQHGKSMLISENSSAQQNAIKNAARALKKECANFKAAPLNY